MRAETSGQRLSSSMASCNAARMPSNASRSPMAGPCLCLRLSQPSRTPHRTFPPPPSLNRPRPRGGPEGPASAHACDHTAVSSSTFSHFFFHYQNGSHGFIRASRVRSPIRHPSQISSRRPEHSPPAALTGTAADATISGLRYTGVGLKRVLSRGKPMARGSGDPMGYGDLRAVALVPDDPDPTRTFRGLARRRDAIPSRRAYTGADSNRGRTDGGRATRADALRQHRRHEGRMPACAGPADHQQPGQQGCRVEAANLLEDVALRGTLTRWAGRRDLARTATRAPSHRVRDVALDSGGTRRRRACWG